MQGERSFEGCCRLVSPTGTEKQISEVLVDKAVKRQEVGALGVCQRLPRNALGLVEITAARVHLRPRPAHADLSVHVLVDDGFGGLIDLQSDLVDAPERVESVRE